MTRERLLAVTGAAILRALFFTLRLRIDDRCGLLEESAGSPVIVCFWHNRILGITFAFDRKYPKKRPGVTVLTSPSKDGEILARLVGAFGMEAVRGSSSRRGSQALFELVRLIRGGRDIAVTPDGPRGPRYSLGPGVILLAQSTGARIVPLHASFSRCVRMKTWDGFIIPLPFSRVSVTIDSAIILSAELTAEEFETKRKQLENLLKHAAD
ncbi:MAG: lysophospholipid acyltransferase family protein [bacterium]